MKKVFSIVMVLTLTLALASAALAQVPVPAPGGPFNSAFRVQNLETTDATCSVQFFAPDGTVAATILPDPVNNPPIAPGDSLYVYVPDVSGLLTGSYSAVVSCDRKVAAVSNFSDLDSGASYSGVAEPGMEWYAPGIYNNYYNYYSNIVVQNASMDFVDIKVEFFDDTATLVLTEEQTDVPANAAVSFSQEGKTQLLKDEYYAAKITATGNVAPIVNIYGKGAVDNQLYSYNAFTVGSTVAYAPVIMSNYYGYNTALVIQNIGDAEAAVTVEYTNNFSKDYTIDAGAAVSIYTPGEAGVPSGDTLYGASVTSDQPVVVLVNESSATGTNRAASYSGFASGSEEVRAPIVMKRYYFYNSSVTCQNIGAAATNMTVAYAGAGVGAPTVYPNVAAGATQLIYQPTDPALASVAPNWIGSATITATEPIVCVVNQDMNELPQAAENMDQLYSYNGIVP